MILLKDNPNIQNSVKGKLSSILSELNDVNCDTAVKMVEWLLEKSKYCKKAFNNEKFPYLPDSIQRGDIVIANFGMNVMPEFSDDGTNGHFALIWGQQGHNFIVIPLTKQIQPDDNKYAINLGKIQGLPENLDTYAKIDAIRSISIRRIRRIREQPKGKITISDEAILNKISDVFLMLFCLKKV